MSLSLRRPTQLDELLNYRLLRLQAASGAPVIRMLEGRYGIARREWRLIALLADRGPLSPSLLAGQLQLDRPRTSRAIGSLLNKKLVAREPQPGDTRRAQVALTPAGQALYAQVFPRVAEINAKVVEVLDDDAVEALDHILARLTERALQVNQTLVQDVGANRHAGGSRRVRPSKTAEET